MIQEFYSPTDHTSCGILIIQAHLEIRNAKWKLENQIIEELDDADGGYYFKGYKECYYKPTDPIY
ncbi:hypothetical protein [Bacillus toyonensis]|uniref:hypothetical protein n=1 Tax=Bacillus toyonensis TaxID=155322 RepID=UPI001C02D8E3|nr:hypothetical protein [Bacillus toyonensis]QWG94737.1 hypothetical protein EXW33_08030 [Bacillus toyonensis]